MLSSLFSIKRVSLLAIAFVLAVPVVRAQTDPTNQIDWTKITITGADSPITTCTSANYGQPFQRTDVTPNKFGTCGSDGWQYRGSGSGSGGVGAHSYSSCPAATGTASELMVMKVSSTCAMPLPAIVAGYSVAVQTSTSSTVSIAPPGGVTLYVAGVSASTLTIPNGQTVFVTTDGISYYATAPAVAGAGVTITPGATGNIYTASGSGAGLPSCSDTSGSGTAQSCSTSPTFTPSANQSCILYNTTTTNSGAGLTVNVNSLGAKSVAIPGTSGWTTTLTASIISSGKPIAMCYDGTNWDVLQTGKAANGGSTLPISTYSLGSGMCHITDSTGPGGGTFADGTTAILYANYNSQGCTGYEYPGSWYTNSSPNTGNATTADIVGVELVANENPPNYGALDYFIQGGSGDVTTCGTALSWGHFSDCTASTKAGVVQGLLWAGTPQGGKILAANAPTTGTWTAYSPYTWNGTTGNASWRNGVGKCGTTGATMTFTTMPASGALWFSYVDISGGTAGANVVIDGGSPVAVTNNVLGTWSTNHLSEMWYPQRFAVSGTGQHTLVVTVTSGSFCPLYVVTPNPSSWDGMQLPNVYASIVPPGSTGYSGSGNDVVVKRAQADAITQVQNDGLHVFASDFYNLTWPESAGNTQYCEYNYPCVYPNGMAADGAPSGDHYNSVGARLNAWAFLQTAKRTPFKNSVTGDGGVTTNTTQVGPNTQVSANGTNVDLLNRANIHSTGTQRVNTGGIANVGRIVRGALGSTATPSPTSSGSMPSCAKSITVATGDVILIIASPQIPGTNMPLATGTRGETFSLIATVPTDLTKVYLSTPTTSSGTDSIAGSTGCGGAIYYDLGTSTTLDGTPSVNYVASVASTQSAGPVVTENSNDLLIAVYATTAFVSGCSTAPSINTSGYSSAATSTADYAFVRSWTNTSTSPGSYSASWLTNTGGCSAGSLLLAFSGAGTAQTADLDEYQNSAGTVLGGINSAGQYFSNDSSCTGGTKVPKADGTGCTTPGSGSGTVNSGTANQLAYYPSTAAAVSGTNALPNGTTASTQSPLDSSTKVASTAYVDAAVAAGGGGGGTTVSTFKCADSSGSATAQTCTASPTLSSLAVNTCIAYTTTTVNTGALTLNVSSLGAKPVVKWLGTALAAGDMPANKSQLLCYDGTNWNASTIGNAPSGGGGGLTPTCATFSGGTSATLSSWYNSSYKLYRLFFVSVVLSGAVNPTVTFNSDSTSGHYQNAVFQNYPGNASAVTDSTTTGIDLIVGGGSPVANHGYNGSATLFDPGNTTTYKTLVWTGTDYYSGVAGTVTRRVTGEWNNGSTPAAITTITIANGGSGSFTSGQACIVPEY
jgi:hypothetical protein